MTIVQNVICDPDQKNPTHHIKLSDGTNTLGFILRAGSRTDPRAITRRPRQNGQYSPFTQSDWGGGRGIKDAQADRSRYSDGKRVITRHNGTVMIGPQETYTTGYRKAEAYLPGNLTWQSLLTSNRYVAYKVTASASGNRSAVYLWVKRLGTPSSTLTVELCSDNSDKPGTVLKTVTATTSDIGPISRLFEFEFSSVQAVTATTVYWVKIYTSTADTSTDCWMVGTDAADTNNLTKASSDNSTWSAASYDLYFRLVDDTELLGALFFQYKGQVYMVTRPTGSNAPKLYVNGDRGVATGTHSTTTLQDSTKSWTNDEWIDSILLIFSGTNSEWTQNYRTITDNTSDTLTFSPFPKAPVSADTTYVILGSNKWTEITGHGLTVLPTSVVVAGDIVYFAQGDKVKMRRMREYVNNVTYTREFTEEDNYAKFLIDFRSPTKGLMVGKANDYDNSGRASFSQAGAEAWGRRLKFPYLINDCEATTGWTAGANATVATDNANFMTKSKSIKITVSSGPANPVAYFAPSSAIDLRGHKALRFWIRSDANRAAGDIDVFLSTSATAASSITGDLAVPALVGTEWQQVTLPFTDTLAGTGGVASIGFRVTAASGNYWIDGIETVPNGSEVPLGNTGEKVTGINKYGDPEVPWIFRTQSAGSIDGGVFNPIPLRELSTAESIYNGVGNVVHNVYLYFSFLHGLERFYRNNLDDVGPNRDEGIPDGRRGFISAMAGYIGRFFYNYDSFGGQSAIFESTSGTDHHEIYRCDADGKRIRNLFIQVIPGNTADRLWFTEGSDVAWLPLPGNTLKEDTDFTFKNTHEGTLETGWITGNEPDAVKLFHSVKLFTENTSASRRIEWDYMKDGDTSYTAVGTSFTTPPVQEISLNISARRVKFRFRLQSPNNTTTPEIRGMVVEATTRPETRYTYSMRTVLGDAPINLRGDSETTITADAVLDQLDSWVANNTVLTMSSLFNPFHNKSVFLEPVVTNPLTRINDEKKERLEATLVLTEP